VGASVLTKAQQLELQELEKKAMAEMKERNPTYASAIAGASSSTIWVALEPLFETLERAGQKMPEQFNPSISSDIPAAVDAAATAYLATDLLRPRGGWSLSAKKRALRRELRDTMDLRAWIAALHLQRARIYLGPTR